MKWKQGIRLVLSILFLAYYVLIISYNGPGTSFSVLWLAGGILTLGLFFWFRYLDRNAVRLSLILRSASWTVLILFLLSFLLVESKVLGTALRKPKQDLPYIIVLGARVNGVYPTPILRDRLETARAYLENNRKTEAIVSGGRGPGEYISEANAMQQYLHDRGISNTRIIREGRSVNTRENLIFSKTFLPDENTPVGIVTSDFHAYRALKLAEANGYREVYPIDAPSDRILFVHYLVREYFAVIKEHLFGHIRF